MGASQHQIIMGKWGQDQGPSYTIGEEWDEAQDKGGRYGDEGVARIRSAGQSRKEKMQQRRIGRKRKPHAPDQKIQGGAAHNPDWIFRAHGLSAPDWNIRGSAEPRKVTPPD